MSEPAALRREADNATNDVELPRLRLVHPDRVYLDNDEQVAALRIIRSLPANHPQAIAAANRVLLATRGVVVNVAKRIARKYRAVSIEELTQEGMLAVASELRRFDPDATTGNCRLFVWAAAVARQRMAKYAGAASSPVYVTRHGRDIMHRLAEAKRQGTEQPEPDASSATTAIAEGFKATELPDEANELAAETPNPEELLSTHQQVRALRAAIEQLPDLQRRVIVLLAGLDEEPLAVRKVAATLGLPSSSVLTLRDAAFATLKAQLA